MRRLVAIYSITSIEYIIKN